MLKLLAVCVLWSQSASGVLIAADLSLCREGLCRFTTTSSIAIDPTNGNLWVADTRNNRVLNFGPSKNLTSASAPVAYLGQNSPTGTVANQGLLQPSFATLWHPTGLAFDSTGGLWVGDSSNNRVLLFNPLSQRTGGTANLVLGQPGGSSNITGNRADQFNNPTGVFIDPNGTLWVADTGNNRVLWFLKATMLLNGDPAQGVLGQSQLDVGLPSCNGSNSMHAPQSVFGTPNGDIYVSDTANNRVVR